jgi:hypothetical protein
MFTESEIALLDRAKLLSAPVARSIELDAGRWILLQIFESRALVRDHEADERKAELKMYFGASKFS